MPLITKGGTTYGPVALVCATICFLASLAMVVYLITEYPAQAEVYIRPLIPTLVTAGGFLILWLKQRKSSEENAHISAQVHDNTQRLESRLNGELDRRIEEAVIKALETYVRTPRAPEEG